MCGILLIATRSAETPATGATCNAVAQFQEGLRCRGPDVQGSCEVTCGPVRLHFHGSLLQLRGTQQSTTPLQDSASGSLLLWNGEVFGGLHVASGSNDGQTVLAALTAPEAAAVPEVLSSIRGPWALVFWQAAQRRLWFGRDAVGRRSLLLHMPTAADNRLVLSSTVPLDPAPPLQRMAEVPPGLYSITFPAPEQQPAGSTSTLPISYDMHAWADPLLLRLSSYERPLQLVPPSHAQTDVQAPDECQTGSASCEDSETPSVELEAAAGRLLAALRQSVATRCSLIDQPAGRAGPLLGSERLKDQSTGVAGSSACNLQPAPVLILFSGGADSTLMAALAHEALPPEQPIDLASICFDDGRSPDRLAAIDALQELRSISPGREWRLIQVNSSLADVDANRARLVQLLAPSDTCMDLNIGAALWLATRAQGVLHHQQRPEAGQPSAPTPGSNAGEQESTQCMPAGEASAAGGTGSLWYISQARVVLLGHGADELLGGYGRHRTRFREGGWEGLDAELALDMRRLWQRNLGRDDRLVADHGREARHPYLDELVIATVLDLPLPIVADLRLPPGQGDKRVLRRCLARLGLPRAATRVKRAIQFGSRLGQKVNARDFGGTRRANARQAGSVRLQDVHGGGSGPAGGEGSNNH